MIKPNMATMLGYLATDARVAQPVLDRLVKVAADQSFNCITIDGDTSTNDTVFVLASGASGAATVTAGTHEAAELGRAIEAVARDLARQQAADGEGATALITCQVSGAVDGADARAVARAVISSSLVKAAVHGRDPNWGRIAGAAGNAALAEEAVLVASGLTPSAARSRAAMRANAATRLAVCERRSVAVTTVPLGRWTSRTPVATLLRCWPPGPPATKKVMSQSRSSDSRSVG